LLFALSGFAIAMSMNAVFPHLAISLAERSYFPGTGSGILLNLPLGLWFVKREMRGGRLTWFDLWSHSLAYTFALAILAFGGLYVAHILRRSPGPGAS
jgi:hypothetical protein